MDFGHWLHHGNRPLIGQHHRPLRQVVIKSNNNLQASGLEQASTTGANSTFYKLSLFVMKVRYRLFNAIEINVKSTTKLQYILIQSSFWITTASDCVLYLFSTTSKLALVVVVDHSFQCKSYLEPNQRLFPGTNLPPSAFVESLWVEGYLW